MPAPKTRTVDQVDDYFGTRVADPYRWLEDGDDPEVRAWLQAQGAYTRTELDALPDRDAIAAALGAAVRLPRSGLPVHRGGRWFRTANDGDQQQDVLLVADAPFGPARTLIDPNLLGGDGSTSLAEWKPSPDGTLVVVLLQRGRQRLAHLAGARGRQRRRPADEVRWSKFTEPVWLPDGSGFLYNAYGAPSGAEFVSQQLGHAGAAAPARRATSDDEVVLALPGEPDITFEAHVTDDGRWLVVTGTRGTDYNARVWVRELGRRRRARRGCSSRRPNAAGS